MVISTNGRVVPILGSVMVSSTVKKRWEGSRRFELRLIFLGERGKFNFSKVDDFFWISMGHSSMRITEMEWNRMENSWKFWGDNLTIVGWMKCWSRVFFFFWIRCGILLWELIREKVRENWKNIIYLCWWIISKSNEKLNICKNILTKSVNRNNIWI